MDWKSIVKSVAPTIGAALGGPLGGMATKFLAEALLGKPDANQEDIADFLVTASPEKLVELKKLDAEFKTKMRELDIDVFELETKDRDSARQMFKTNIWPQIILSAVFIGGYFFVLYGLLNGTITIQEAIKDTALLLIGLLTREVPTIMQFWFGSSMGSKDKTSALSGDKQ